MATIDRAGDRSRWISQERYDIQDITNDALLNEALIMRQGGIMGKCAGIIGDPPTFTWDAVTQRLAVGPCILAYSTSDGNGYEAQFAAVRYDPTQSWQTQQAPNLGAYSVAGIPVTLWAQRTQGNADSATRKVWSAGAEVSQTVETVYREKVIMTATATSAPAPWPWFPFAKVTWTAGTPTVIPLDVWDGDFQASALGNAAAMTAFPAVPTANVDFGTTLSRGLVNMMTKVRASLAKIIDASDATAWWNTAAITRGVVGLETDVAHLQALPLSVASATFRPTAAGTYSPLYGKGVSPMTAVGSAGDVLITVYLPAGWQPACAVAVPIVDAGGGYYPTPPISYPTVRFCFAAQPGDWIPLGSDSYRILVNQYDTSSVLTDGPFALTVYAYKP